MKEVAIVLEPAGRAGRAGRAVRAAAADRAGVLLAVMHLTQLAKLDPLFLPAVDDFSTFQKPQTFLPYFQLSGIALCRKEEKRGVRVQKVLKALLMELRCLRRPHQVLLGFFAGERERKLSGD